MNILMVVSSIYGDSFVSFQYYGNIVGGSGL